MEIDRSEVLRYLGFRGEKADKATLQAIESCLKELSSACTPRCLSRIFPVELSRNAVTVNGVTIISSDLRSHIDGCREVVLFAATLGVQADNLMRRYSKTGINRAVILQACAAAIIEQYCDDCCDGLAKEVKPRGLYLRPRYSPGYGDFNIKHQTDLLAMLDCAKKIGLTATDSYMLAPSKSVTAIIGLTTEPKSCHIARCMDCKSVNCPFRKG